MALYQENNSLYNPAEYPDAFSVKVGIVTASWNNKITSKLFDGAVEVLKKSSVKENNLISIQVPGSYELTAGAQWLFQHHSPDVVIALGCVIQGETRHFDFICNAVAIGLTDLNTAYSIPFIFGVLTPENMAQAKARAGGKHGNKGVEAAVTAIKMVALKESVVRSR